MVDAELEDKSTTGPEVCNVPNKSMNQSETRHQTVSYLDSVEFSKYTICNKWLVYFACSHKFYSAKTYDLSPIDDSFITRFVSGLTNDEVVAQVFMLYLAGHETTANTLTFVSYELALNQEVQDRVIQEIQDQIGEVIHRCTCSSKLLNLR